MGETRIARRGLRRWPALAFLVAAGALAILLPSGLIVPTSGPQTLAEFAPVPGRGEGAGDVSQFGDASSDGLGAGQAPAGAAGAIGAPEQQRARLKRCVGTPPRQTEDELSPPCVAFFEGDNFGATWRGVTADEIIVAIHWGQFGSPPSERFEDYDRPLQPEDRQWSLAGKVYSRFFNERYQTYGRRVHLWGYYGAAGSVEQFRAEVGAIDSRLRPFAFVPPPAGDAGVHIEEAVRRGMVVAAYRGLERGLYRSAAPLLFSFAPDLEDNARQFASYICTKIAGRRAKHSGNATDVDEPRVFGLLYSDQAEQPTNAQLAKLIRPELDRTCGVKIAHEAGLGPAFTNSHAYASTFASMRTAGVTTVIWVSTSQDIIPALTVAQSQSWYPEWVFPRSPNGRDVTGQLYPQAEWQHAFGFSYDRRRGRVEEQDWYRAVKDACSSCEDVRYAFFPNAYETLSMLLYGIQAAGPRLTPPSLDKGLHAIPERPSISPYVPATYFTPGNFSWVKDSKEMWWDPSGVAPGESAPGCYRLVYEGRRFRASEWPSEDLDHDPSAGPCQGFVPIT